MIASSSELNSNKIEISMRSGELTNSLVYLRRGTANMEGATISEM